MSVFDPLSPNEITLLKVFFLTLYPPGTLLEYLLDQHVVVTISNDVFISPL